MSRSSLLLFLVFVFLVLETSNGFSVPAIFSFGDSIFDAGNNHYIPNSTAQADFSPYGSTFFHHPTGRFTNGRTVPDFISQFMKIPLQKPYLEAEIEMSKGATKKYPSNGINFASAGSGVLPATNQEMVVIPLHKQVQQFEAIVEQNLIDKNVIKQAFFFFESGSNDIFNYFNPHATPNLGPEPYIQAMLSQVENCIDRIYKLGARRIVLFSLGPVGCIPARVLLLASISDKCFGKMNKLVKNYNRGLENLANTIPNKYPGAIGIYGAVYTTVQSFRANPKLYGFSDVTNACCGDGALGGEVQCGKGNYTMCRDPNGHLFWDFFHPSERTNKLVSKALWTGGSSQIRPINLKKLANITIT